MREIKIAVIDHNVLAAMGLQRILTDIIPVADVQVFISFDALRQSAADDFVHYFVSSRIYFEYASFFKENGKRPIVLVNGDMQVAGVPTLNVCQPERSLVKSILATHRMGHGERLEGRQGNERGGVCACHHVNERAGVVHGMDGGRHDAQLSPREAEVVVLLAKGFINKEIADRLNISVTTVITHRRNIMEKLHARSLADVIIYAVMNGFVEVGDI